MDTAAYLTEEIGSRLTGFPGPRGQRMDEGQARGVGARQRPPGAVFRSAAAGRSAASVVRIVAPHEVQLLAYPKAWTPGTDGPVRGRGDAGRYSRRRRLQQVPGEARRQDLVPRRDSKSPRPRTARSSSATTRKGLGVMPRSRSARGRPAELAPESPRSGCSFRKVLARVPDLEKVAATVETAPGAQGIVRVTGGGCREPGRESRSALLGDGAASTTTASFAARREAGRSRSRSTSQTRFHDDDPRPTTSSPRSPAPTRRDEIVMLGAHFDSWHGGTGATDNARRLRRRAWRRCAS